MLHGRDDELDSLDRALGRALAGQVPVNALVGEAGIGKTSVASEHAGRAAARGLRVSWGRAWEAGGGAAFLPWRQLVSGLRPSPEVDQLQGLWGRPGAGELSAADPAADRLQLFEAAVGALRASAAERPLLCIFDDLHAADTASLELLAFVLRGLKVGRCGFLLTWRDAEAERPRVRDLLSAIGREAAVLALQPLTSPQSARLVAEALGEVDPATCDTLAHATGGNPLFLVEVLRSLRLQGRQAPLGPLPVSGGVAGLVRERCRALSPQAVALLQLAAVVGRHVEGAQLAEAGGDPRERVSALAATLCEAGFWRERSPEAWSFSHAVVRDAVYRDLAPALRRDLHGRCARAAEARVRRGDRGAIRARAHHALEAVPSLEPEEVVRWAIEAAAEARAECAYEDAASVLEHALAVVQAGPRLEAELLLALGWAHGDAGRSLGMRESLQRALVLARGTGDGPLLARAVIALGSRYVLGDIRTDLLPLLDEAEASLGGQPGALHARLVARRAAALTPAEDADVPLAMARRALEEVAGAGDAQASVDVAVAAGSAMGDFADARERIPVNTALVAAARERKDRVLELRGLGRLVTDHLEAGDVARADAALSDWNRLCEAVRHPRFLWMAPMFASMRGAMAGAFGEAHAAVEEARRRASAAGDENARRTLAVHRHWLLLLEGDQAALEAHQAEALAALGLPMPELGTLVRLSTLSRAGDHAAVQAELVRSVPPELPRLQATMALLTLGELLAPLPPTPQRAQVQARLLRRQECNGIWGLFGFVCGVPVTAVLGLLADAAGDGPAADAHFEAALARTRRMGAPAHEAWVAWWAGAAAQRRGGAGADRGRRSLDQALELAGRLGMPGLRARIEAARAGRPPPAAPVAVALEFALERQGEGWQVRCQGRTGFVRDLRGMGMLARLVAQPDRELHALELASGADGEHAVDAGDSGELLDATARAAYQRRARTLSGHLDEAEAAGDAVRADALQSELEALARELSRARGLGGRQRRAGAASERARIVVQRRVREAIARVAQVDPALGAHLQRCIRTGTFSSYGPLRDRR